MAHAHVQGQRIETSGRASRSDLVFGRAGKVGPLAVYLTAVSVQEIAQAGVIGIPLTYPHIAQGTGIEFTEIVALFLRAQQTERIEVTGHSAENI